MVMLVALSARAGSCFERYYGKGTGSRGEHFARAADGSFLIVGSAWDSVLAANRYYLLHVDSTGTPLFDTTFSTSMNNLARSVTAMPDGRFAMVGTRVGFLFDAVTEVHLLNSLARPVLSQTYPPFDGWGTSGIGILTARDSSLCITQYTDGFLSSNFFSMMNLQEDLSVRWSAFLAYDDGMFNEHSAVQCEDGRFKTTAYFQEYWYSFPELINATEVRTLAEGGAQLADSIYSLGMESHSIDCGTGNKIFLTGRTDSTGSGDACVVILDSNGTQLLRRTWGGNVIENPVQVVALSDGGWSLLSEIGSNRFPGKKDLLLTRFSASGDSLWSRQFGGPANDLGRQLMNLPDGGYAILGVYEDDTVGKTYFIKTDSSGIVRTDFRISGDSAFLCTGQTAHLTIVPTPPAGSRIEWSSGDTTLTLDAMSSGLYQVSVTTPGSSSVLSNIFPVYSAPIPDARLNLPDTAALCSKTALELSGLSDPTFTYQWFRNNTLLPGESNFAYTPAISGLYTTVVSNYCGFDTASVFIDSLFALPQTPSVIPAKANPICPGDSVQLFVPLVSGTLQWYRFDGSIISLIPGAFDTTLFVSETSEYGVRVTNGNGCSALSEAYWMELDQEYYFVNANGPISFCASGQVQLSAGEGSGYQWSNGDSLQHVLVNSTGQYSYQCLSPAGCFKRSDTLLVTVLDLPPINLGSDTVLCSADTLTLDAGAGFIFYQWSGGSFGQSFSLPFTAEGDTVQVAAYVTDTNYCSNGDTLQVIMTVCNRIVEEAPLPGFFVFPNPVPAGQCEIRVVLPDTGQDAGHLLLYAQDGRLAQDLGETSGSRSYRIDPLASGIYHLIRLKNGTISGVQRLVIE